MTKPNTLRLGHLVQFHNGQDWKNVQTDDGEYPVYGSGGEFGRASSFLWDGEAILFGRKGTVNKPLYVDGKFWTVDTMYYTTPRSEKVSAKYIYYWATTIPFQTIITNTALPSVTSTDLSLLRVPVRTRCEQDRIVNYLDRETAEIDAAVADLENYSHLLKQRKTQTIFASVSSDNGKRFPQRAIQYLFQGIASGTTPRGEEFYVDPESQRDSYPWVTTSELRETNIEDTKRHVTAAALSQHSALTVHPAGSILIAMYGATIGRFGRLTNKATTNQACCALSEPKGIDEDFFSYCMFILSPELVRQASGGGQPNINQDVIRRQKVPLPPLEKQKSIVKKLDAEIPKIDSLIAEAEELRDLLLKRRSVLITEVVTGRKKV